MDTNKDEKLSWSEVKTFFFNQVKQQKADPAAPGTAPKVDSLLSQPQISWNCTYRCGIWNTCMVKAAWNGDTTKCGSEPAGCQCVWGSL